jgi:hypothetical protein
MQKSSPYHAKNWEPMIFRISMISLQIYLTVSTIAIFKRKKKRETKLKIFR